MKQWKTETKVIFIDALISLGIFLCLLPCHFFSLGEIPSGFLFGSVIGVLCYYLLILQADAVLKKQSSAAFVPYFILRLACMILGIALALVLWDYGYHVFNVFAVFAGYLPIRLVMMFYKGKEVDQA